MINSEFFIVKTLLNFAEKYDKINIYQKVDAFELEFLTHREEPWIEARGNANPWEACNTIISEDTMKKYYRGIMA